MIIKFRVIEQHGQILSIAAGWRRQVVLFLSSGLWPGFRYPPEGVVGLPFWGWTKFKLNEVYVNVNLKFGNFRNPGETVRTLAGELVFSAMWWLLPIRVCLYPD
ncbi:hypothetical protein [Marinobacter fuscus]|uniref:hypothetical protein n=1 Tax=Marinobacter fuscus TaxID=2109942 RepID=UPI0010575EC8|nr:hypothetical protein [Marinobacter fuscus]